MDETSDELINKFCVGIVEIDGTGNQRKITDIAYVFPVVSEYLGELGEDVSYDTLIDRLTGANKIELDSIEKWAKANAGENGSDYADGEYHYVRTRVHYGSLKHVMDYLGIYNNKANRDLTYQIIKKECPEPQKFARFSLWKRN